MPAYPYECNDCASKWDVIKTVADIDLVESCPKCQSTSNHRYVTNFTFYGASDWDKAEYNPAFGKIIRNAKHRKEEARRLGVEEIGNESPDKIHAHYEKQLDKQIDDSWDKV